MQKRVYILGAVLIALVGIILILENRSKLFRFLDEVSVELGPVSNSGTPEIGKEAPDFTLLDYQGRLHKRSDYTGMPLVLNFWASWCPFCINEMPDMEEVYSRLNADQQVFELVAINRGESRDKARSFTDPLNLSYTLLLNRADDVSRAYRVRAMPSTYFIDDSGVIVDIKLGPMSADEFSSLLNENFGIGKQKAFPQGEESELFPPEMPEDTMSSKRTISITNGVKHSVPLHEIQSGGPPKDGIPSIDNPRFVSITEADKILEDGGLGISVSFNGVKRFYPFQILVWHEIVNDVVAGQPVLITYCPLCGTGIAFEPFVNGKVTEFGTSGKLWNSNLVMYDRQTDSYWSEILGEAIVGEMTGTRLKVLPHQVLTYQDWKEINPDGQVLSTETGHIRDYSRSPYGDYDISEKIIFPVNNRDDRYHAKEFVFKVNLNDETKIYPLEELEKTSGSFSDTLGGIELVLTYDFNLNTLDIRRKDGKGEIIPIHSFWFAAIASNPQAAVFTAE